MIYYIVVLFALISNDAFAAKTLEIMAEDAAAPWSNADGSGYANEIVLASFSAVHTEVKLLVVPYARCKKYVMAGSVAGCLSMADAPELHDKVWFADLPLYQAYPRIYFNPKHPIIAKSVDALPTNIRIGIVNGYEYPLALTEKVPRGTSFVEARSELTNIKKLAMGRIDVAVIMMDDMKTENMLVKAAGVQNIAFAFQMPPEGSFIGFSKKHPEGDSARLLFNRGYRIIMSNGVKLAIDRKWHLQSVKR
ncbi:hypothetical protein [Rugamonas sp.]|uniref:substrate-binding periplasmic protein n=1 Tax=Rugamonas sp. TaxID=1926287 RepID=UPI0025DAFF93|nr:hypothetical protein [Rugamonas sp.]